jgi:tetratricopeptide (TPR) repeat protein
LICGPPTAGKTRTALELAYELNPPFVIVWPRDMIVGETPVLPEYKGFFVILADDISLGASPEKSEIPAYLDYIIQRCPQAILIATSRQSLLPEDIRTLAVKPLEVTDRDKLNPLAESIAQAESSAGKPITAQQVMDRFNGYPGSLVAGVEAMQSEYAKLDKEAQAFLQVIPILWNLGIRQLSIKRMWDSYQDLFGSLPGSIQQESILNQLEKKGFFTLVREPIPGISVPDPYREQVFPPILSIIDPDQKLWEGFIARQDGDAFLEMGNSWSEEYSEAYQSNPRGALRKAITAYEQALVHYTPERSPLDYAMTQNNLGNAYGDLAGYEQPVENLQRAVAAYAQALVHYTPERSPLQYATTQNNLGNAYGDLAKQFEEINQACYWLDLAISSFNEALFFLTEETSPLRHQQVKANLANAVQQARERGCKLGSLMGNSR